MTIKSLRLQLQPRTAIIINNESFTILQHIVWWQAKANKTYDKYVLENASGNKTTRLFISGDFIGLATLIQYEFQEPLPKRLTFQGKKYTLKEDEFCLVKSTEGEQVYRVGDGEIWWDYTCTANDGTGLSLGRNWENWKREDLTTKELFLNELTLLPNHTI